MAPGDRGTRAARRYIMWGETDLDPHTSSNPMKTDKTPPPFDPGILLPERHAAYRPVLREALVYFLGRLAPDRLREIAAAQRALGAGADPAARLVALMRCCPTLHKLGQVVARHRGLDAEVRTHLQQLESCDPAHSVDEVRPVIDADFTRLGVAEDLRIAGRALAEASVSVIVPVTWHRTPSGPRQEGVLKVLKPGIEQKLEEELAILADLADHLDDLGIEGAPPLDYRETFDTVRELLLREVKLDIEQRNITDAVARYAPRRDVWIPRLLPFCTPRITAMERIYGRQVTAVTDLPRWRLEGLARIIVDAMVADTVFSRAETTVFHADPHAGNLFATDEGKLAILDWSLTGRLSKADRVSVTSILLSAVQLDARGMARAIGDLARSRVDESLLTAAAESALAELRRGRLMGPAWLVRLLDRAAESGTAFSGDLLLFRKMLLTLGGVIADVCEGASLDAILTASGLHAFLKDWPNRLWTPIDSRDFATHVSNGDLMRLCLTAPFVAGSYWLRAWRDWTLAASPLR
ncbi:MAG: hypothetical protein DCC65_17125 [Planctomycetota bacterium]|nr:MAG: hypothetical protein DCC65_17125 [Planctomycetota bacterium]